MGVETNVGGQDFILLVSLIKSMRSSLVESKLTFVHFRL